MIIQHYDMWCFVITLTLITNANRWTYPRLLSGSPGVADEQKMLNITAKKPQTML